MPVTMPVIAARRETGCPAPVPAYGTVSVHLSVSGLRTPLLLLHTYYGYFATGGPSGVGVAVGHAVRTSLIVVVSVTLLVSLAVYGSNGNFNLSG